MIGIEKLTFLLLLFVMAMILHAGCSHIEFDPDPDPDYEFTHEAQEKFKESD